MPRPRTGTLEWDPRKRVYKTRVMTVEDGKPVRATFSLGTADRKLAERKRAALLQELAAKEASLAAPVVDRAAPRFGPFALERVAGRKDRVKFVGSEKGHLKLWILPVLKDVLLADVTEAHARTILKGLVDAKKRRQTITHVFGTLCRTLDLAVRRELISENVARKLSLAAELNDLGFQDREEKPREVLKDSEFEKLMTCPEVDLEIQVLGLTARCIGGARTRDLTALTWEHCDVPDFAWIAVPRTKTKRPQKFELPRLVRARMAAWWIEKGKARTGPVFPVRRGPRKGEARRDQGVSFAERLRRALLTAGVTRHELHHETPFSLPVDFHSFRRAFSSALANAGVNEQTAMALTGHADAKAHRRYLTAVDAQRALPSALPDFMRRQEQQLEQEAAARRASWASASAPQAAPAHPPEPGSKAPTEGVLARVLVSENDDTKIVNHFRAGNGVRTRDPQLGKLMLYQLSYSRKEFG